MSDATALLPETVKQKELMQDILNRIEDADRMHEYYDYLQKPTREKNSEFITQVLENKVQPIILPYDSPISMRLGLDEYLERIQEEL